MINGSTALLGLLGNPVRHSLSPVMQNAALEAMGVNWTYLALPCESQDLGSVLTGLEALGCRGLNVTIPHKQRTAELCDELSPLARRLGAVNTLIPRKQGGWHGTNTDVEGFLTPLNAQQTWKHRHAVVLGCGGSARAVVAGLQSLKLGSITVIARRPEALDDFISNLHLPDAPILGQLENDDDLNRSLEQADLVVNTTPVGMNQHGDANALPLGTDCWQNLNSQATLYDLIYTPRPTPWLHWGLGHGLRCIDGLEMLVQQGAASLRMWSDHSVVPVEAMRSAAETALKS